MHVQDFPQHDLANSLWRCPHVRFLKAPRTRLMVMTGSEVPTQEDTRVLHGAAGSFALILGFLAIRKFSFRIS